MTAGSVAARKRGSAGELLLACAAICTVLAVAAPQSFFIAGLSSAAREVSSALAPAGLRLGDAVENRPSIEKNSERLSAQVRFEKNEGQADPNVKFTSRVGDYSVLFTPQGAEVRLGGTSEASAGPGGGTSTAGRVLIRPLNANPNPEIQGQGSLAGTTNYLRGNDPQGWVTGVRSFRKVLYSGIYPGIDMVFYGTAQGQLEYDFLVSPGTDPKAIELAFDGAGAVGIQPDGSLDVQTPAGTLKQEKPVLYQNSGQSKKSVVGSYVADGAGRVRFEIGNYDRSKPLIIDPIISYSTYLGATRKDKIADIAVDSSGHAYVVGSTTSGNFPTTIGVGDGSCGGDGDCDSAVNSGQPQFDVFVSKLTPDGSGLVYSTYLGGSASDEGVGIAVDRAGSAHVTGRTKSFNYPITQNAVDKTCGTEQTRNCDRLVDQTGVRATQTKADLFVTKLTPDGAKVAYSSFLGGSGDDGRAGSVSYAADINGNPTFEERSSHNFTETGPSDYAGSDPSSAAIAVGPDGAIYVTGATLSGGYPTTPGALDSSCGSDGSCDQKKYWAPCSTLDPDSSSSDPRSKVNPKCPRHVDPANTASLSEGAYVMIHSDAFLVKIDPEGLPGAGPSYLSYLGGRRADVPYGMAVWKDPAGKEFVYLAGFTQSPNSSNAAERFPTTDGKAFQARPTGPADPQADTNPFAARSESNAFVLRLDLTKSGADSLEYSTLLGGEAANKPDADSYHRSGEDSAYDIAVDAVGHAYVTGRTNSFTLKTKGEGARAAVQPEKSARSGEHAAGAQPVGFDAFVAKVNPSAAGQASLVFSTYLGGPSDEPAAALQTRAGSESGNAIAVDAQGSVYVAGQTTSSSFPTVNAEPHDRPGTGTCTPDTDTGTGGQCPDAFFTALNSSASKITYSTYLRGEGQGKQDGAQGMAAWSDPANGSSYAYLAGRTNSSGFPTTGGSIQDAKKGEYDGFVTKITDITAPAPVITGIDPDTNKGPLAGGTWVKIRGRNLHGTDAVKFGDLIVDCPSDKCRLESDGTGISVQSPPSSRPGPVDVTILSGSFSSPVTAVGRFTYTPVVTGVEPSGGPASGGTQVVLTGEGLSRASFVSFGARKIDCPSAACNVRPDGTSVTVTTPLHVAGSVDLKIGTDTELFGVTEQVRGSRPHASFVFYQGAWSMTSNAPIGRSHHASIVLGGPACVGDSRPPHCGKVLVVGGVATDTSLPERRSAQLYDPRTGSWSAEHCEVGPLCPGRLKEPRSTGFAATALKDGRVLIAGGTARVAGPTGPDNGARSVEIYDPATGIWQPSCPPENASATCPGELNTDRVGHTATLLRSGKVLVTGGSGKTTNSSVSTTNSSTSPTEAVSQTAELFDPATGRWSMTDPLNESREGLHTATLLKDGRVLVAGGSSPDGSRDSLEIFDPQANNGLGSWELVAEGFPREAHSATLLTNGKVLIAGGVSDLGFGRLLTTAAELFDPEAKDPASAFAYTSALSSSRSGHAAVPLPGGKAMVAGGSTLDAARREVPLSSVEIFHPELDDGKGGWVTGAPMLAARGQPDGGPTLTALPGDLWSDSAECTPNCGRVLAFGGTNNEGTRLLRSAELYSAAPVITKVDPASGTLRGGTVVKISGAGFEPAATVFFDGKSASRCQDCPADTPMQLTRVVPASTGSATPEIGVITKGVGYGVTSGLFTYTGVSAVGGLTAQLLSPREIKITFKAAAVGGPSGPPARKYLVKQSTLPITDDNFDAAKSLCNSEHGLCIFDPQKAGDELTVTVEGLRPDTRYFYAAKAQDEQGAVGAISDVISVLTGAVSPDRVGDLSAAPASAREARLTFSAVGVDEKDPPPARDYVIKQSRSPLTDQAAFDAAEPLCGGVCTFGPGAVGDRLTVRVTGLSPATGYHYAVRARDAAGNLSPLSNIASVVTGAADQLVSVLPAVKPGATNKVTSARDGGTVAGAPAPGEDPRAAASTPLPGPTVEGEKPPVYPDSSRAPKVRVTVPDDLATPLGGKAAALISLAAALFLGLMGFGGLLNRKLRR